MELTNMIICLPSRTGIFSMTPMSDKASELNDNIMTDACMTHFTTLELHADLDFVSVVKKTACVLELGFEIMRIDAAGKLNFLDIDRLLFLFRFLFLLVTFEAELSVVHYAANGRSGIGRNFHKIQILAIGKL